jgi:hypothetical protein
VRVAALSTVIPIAIGKVLDAGRRKIRGSRYLTATRIAQKLASVTSVPAARAFGMAVA